MILLPHALWATLPSLFLVSCQTWCSHVSRPWASPLSSLSPGPVQKTPLLPLDDGDRAARELADGGAGARPLIVVIVIGVSDDSLHGRCITDASPHVAHDDEPRRFLDVIVLGCDGGCGGSEYEIDGGVERE